VIAGHRVAAKGSDIHTMTLDKGAPRDGSSLRVSSPSASGVVGRGRGTGRTGHIGRGRGRAVDLSTIPNVQFPLD